MAKKILHANEINGELVEKVWKGGWTELILCSEGGCIYAVRAICDYLLLHEKKVIVTGWCASAAPAIAACGVPTLATVSTRFMLHKSDADGVGGSEKELRNCADEIRLADDWFYDLLAKRTGTDRQVWVDLCREESWFGVKVAMELGLIDGVL